MQMRAVALALAATALLFGVVAATAQGDDGRGSESSPTRSPSPSPTHAPSSSPSAPSTRSPTHSPAPTPPAAAEPDEAKRDRCMKEADGPEQRHACQEAYCARHQEQCRRMCAEHPDAQVCRTPCKDARADCAPCPAHVKGREAAPGGSGPGSGPSGSSGSRPGPDGPEAGCKPCPEARRTDGACRIGDAGAAHVTFTLREDQRGVEDYRVDGRLVAGSVRIDAAGEPRVEKGPHALRVKVGESVLALQDNPTGLVHFKSQGPGVLIVAFPPDARAEDQGKGLRVRYGDGREAFVESPHIAAGLGNNTYRFEGFLSMHIAPLERPLAPEAAKVRHEVRQAIEKRHVGAEVHLRGDRSKGPAEAEVLAYGDMAVNVTGHATPESPLRLTLSSDLDEGRTIVVNVTRDLLVSLDPAALRLAYFDVNDDGTRTEVVFRPASSLSDILDPRDDAGQPEYYIVQDQEGLQVMVSVPHWSVHEVTLASVGEFLAQPSVMAGLVAGLAGTLLLSVALFAPRRRNDE